MTSYLLYSTVHFLVPALKRCVHSLYIMLNQSFSLHHKVFDDGNSLVEVFPSEVKDIMTACADVQRHSVRKIQVVVAASHWSDQLKSLVSQYTPHATAVFTCAIEAFIKAEGELVSASFGIQHLLFMCV